MAEELVNNSYKQMKEGEGQRIVAMDAFMLAKQRIKDLNAKLTEANREKKRAKVALKGVDRQADNLRLL